MTTHKFGIGNWSLSISNIPDEKKAKPVMVDKGNKELEYVPGTVKKGYYVDPETKKEVPNDSVFKRGSNGKPTAKLGRTEHTDKFKEIEAIESYDWEEYACYKVDNVPSDLMAILQSGKAIKTVYTPGNGDAKYYAFVRINISNKRVEMSLSRPDKCKSQKFQELDDIEKGKKKIKTVTLQEGVEESKIEDLLEL